RPTPRVLPAFAATGRSGTRGRSARHVGECAAVAAFLLSLRPWRYGPRCAAAVGLRPGEPAQLLSLVEHAGRGTALPRGGRRSASAGCADRPGAAHAKGPEGTRPGHGIRRQLARLPPL